MAHRPQRKADDTAMIIYTSGSTGFPKGVMMTHRNIAAAAASITTYLENREDDVILGVLPLAYATGAGAAARNSVGTTVAGGMLASTFLSIVFIPVLYVVIRTLAPGRTRGARPAAAAGGEVAHG